MATSGNLATGGKCWTGPPVRALTSGTGPTTRPRNRLRSIDGEPRCCGRPPLHGTAAVQDGGRLRCRRLRLQSRVQPEHGLPALLLHRRRRHLRRRGRHHVPGRAAVGRVRRPARRPAGGPHHDPVGQVPAVHHVRRRAAAVHELPGLPRPDQLRPGHEADLRLRHLRDPGADLLAGQHPLRLAGLGDHPVGARARQAGRRPRVRRRHRRRRPHLHRRQLHQRPARPEGPHPEPRGPDRLPGGRAGCVHQGHAGLHRHRVDRVLLHRLGLP